MATPLTASQLLNAFEQEGCDPKEYKSWRTHNRNHKGQWGGVNGVVIHHTAGRDSLSLCYNGTSALPGPLCHVHLAKNGAFSLLSAGRANHAGTFAQNAHDAVVNESSVHPRPSSSEPVDGNARYYGIEVENLGNGTDPYPVKQYEQVVRFAAALCRKHGWSQESVIGHKEGTTRKIDPKGPVGTVGGPAFDMNQFRRDVKAALALPAGRWAYGTAQHTPTPAPKPETPKEDDVALTTEDVKKIVKTDGLLKSPDSADPNETNKFWTLESYAYETYRRVREVRDAVEILEARQGNVDLDALADLVVDRLAARLQG